jgi:hypothetical protein
MRRPTRLDYDIARQRIEMAQLELDRAIEEATAARVSVQGDRAWALHELAMSIKERGGWLHYEPGRRLLVAEPIGGRHDVIVAVMPDVQWTFTEQARPSVHNPFRTELFQAERREDLGGWDYRV